MPSNPASTPPVHAIFGSRLTTIEARLTALEVWIRTYGSGVGAWTKLETVNASLKAASTNEPEVRIEENGARAYLRGAYEATAEIAANAALFTVPSICRPIETTRPSVRTISSAATPVSIYGTLPTTGVMAAPLAVPEGGFIWLDGANWSLT